MTHTDIATMRLRNQQIARPHFTKPEEVVRWMGAMQAQDYGQALWAIGLRTKSATITDVEQAIAHGKILRTWPMRGTLHFVASEDAKWMLQLLTPRMVARDKRRLEQLELDQNILKRCGELLHHALQGGKRLSRPAVMELFETSGVSTTGQRGYHILWYLAQSGLICLGPLEGKQQTFVLLDEWVPHSRALSHEESLAELARRYFTSHGPATAQDFATWSGMTLTDARRGLEFIKTDLAQATLDGAEYWFVHTTDDTSRSSEAYMLPGFDEYLLGYKDRRSVLESVHASKVVPGGNGVFFPMLVLDGQVVGTWKRQIKKHSVEIAVTPFSPDIAPEIFTAAATKYSDFMLLPAELTTRSMP